jgi:uncharacterized membrane protein
MGYRTIEWIHVLAACLYVGGSFANGLAKFLADRAGSAVGAASILEVTRWNNRALLVPATIVLPATGLWMARERGIPLASGWLRDGLLLFAVLTAALVWAVRMEERLHRLAEQAGARGEELPAAYRRYGPVYAGLGLASTGAMLLVLHLMVFQQPLWP